MIKWIRTSRLSIHNSLSSTAERGGTEFAADGGLVFKAHRLLYHSTLRLRVIKREREDRIRGGWRAGPG